VPHGETANVALARLRLLPRPDWTTGHHSARPVTINGLYDTVIHMEEVLTIRVPKGTRRRLEKRARAEKLTLSQVRPARTRCGGVAERVRGGPVRARADRAREGRLYGRRRLQDRFVTVVLDTNVVVAALVAEGLCREVVHRAVRLRVLASSSRLLDEQDTTLDRKFKITPASTAFLKAFRGQIRLVEPAGLQHSICRS